MNFERMFRATMTETVTLEAPTGVDSYAQQDYTGATVLTYSAWLNRKPTEVRTTTGQTRTSETTVYLGEKIGAGGDRTPLADLTTPTPLWRLTLPDGSQPPIIYVRELRDPSGDRHIAIYC